MLFNGLWIRLQIYHELKGAPGFVTNLLLQMIRIIDIAIREKQKDSGLFLTSFVINMFVRSYLVH